MNTTSIISLDLGGKNTGFFSCTTNDFNNLKNFQSGTIIYDESFILSQVNRRGYTYASFELSDEEQESLSSNILSDTLQQYRLANETQYYHFDI